MCVYACVSVSVHGCEEGPLVVSEMLVRPRFKEVRPEISPTSAWDNFVPLARAWLLINDLSDWTLFVCGKGVLRYSVPKWLSFL
jgi:hypothetical protein